MPLVRKGGGPLPGAAAPAAAAQLRAETADERWAAARALSGQTEAIGARSAPRCSRRKPDGRVREALLTGLARIGTPESAEAILPLIRSDDADVRTGALDALRLMPRALEAHLAGLLEDPDADVRLLACELARDLPSPVATQMLSDLLAREPEPNVCAAAVEVLAECGGPDALPVLSACAARFSDVPFLVFSLRVAGDRIRAQSNAPNG